MLEKRLKQRGPRFLLHSFPDILYGQYSELGQGAFGDVLYFDYGVVVIWGLTKKQEEDVLKNLVAPCQEFPLPATKTAKDEFQFNYTANETANIQNDTITIDYRMSSDHMVKIAISHALAQSTKLVHFEARCLDIITNTKDLPEHLATTGEIMLNKKEIARLIGTVFIEKSRVNLLSTVLVSLQLLAQYTMLLQVTVCNDDLPIAMPCCSLGCPLPVLMMMVTRLLMIVQGAPYLHAVCDMVAPVTVYLTAKQDCADIVCLHLYKAHADSPVSACSL